MKKLMSVLLLFMIGILVACNNEPALPRLPTPTGITVSKNLITFNPVDGADKYVVNVNSVNTTISFTQYSINQPGTYQIQVKATGKNYRDSLYSTPVTMIVGYLNYPTDIHILNNVVNFTAIPHATSYNIEIDGIVYNTSENPPLQLAPGTYSVRVQALSNTYINSAYSPIVQLTVEGSNDLEKLPTPEGILIDKNVITFDEVEGADQYVISLNSNGIVITDTNYVVIEPGTYDVQVRARGVGFADSDFSDSYPMMVGFLTYPTIVEINQGMILFTKIDDADSYNIEINGAVFNTEDNFFGISVSGQYSIRLQAISNVFVDSPYSPFVNFYVEDPIINTEHMYRYSQISDFDLPLYIYPAGPVLDVEVNLLSDDEIPIPTPLESSKYHLNGNTVYLKASYLDELQARINPYKFTLKSNVGQHKISININQSTRPYAYTDTHVEANLFTDVQFLIETFNGTLSSIGSIVDAPITNQDYVFTNGKLLIKNSYITKTFDMLPNVNEIQLLCGIKVDGTSLIIPIYIVRPGSQNLDA